MIPLNFEELNPPINIKHFGWYVAGIAWADEANGKGWYLHDDGVVRDYCCSDSFPQSTGWYKTVEEAYDAACAYYTANGYVYPYALSSDGEIYDMDGTPSIKDTVHSEVMKFI